MTQSYAKKSTYIGWSMESPSSLKWSSLKVILDDRVILVRGKQGKYMWLYQWKNLSFLTVEKRTFCLVFKVLAECLGFYGGRGQKHPNLLCGVCFSFMVF